MTSADPRGFAELDREIDFEAALERVRHAVVRTPLVEFDAEDARVAVRLKLECLQATGSFKARGATNQIARLTPAERSAGVVTVSSGNHGKALAWAAERSGVRATIVMPADAYPNKIQACRDHGADVVLAASRAAAEEACLARVAAGATLVHPYDAARTVEGAGTVGWELAEDWPDVEVVIVPVGGGGLAAGVSLALQRRLGNRVRVIGAEPEGAATLTRGLASKRAVVLERIESQVQGLCPPYAGDVNVTICERTLAAVVALPDAAILAAQADLVNRGGWVVEPGGAAAFAVVHSRRLPEGLLAGRSEANPLRVACVVSGGNADPAQLARVRAGA